MWSGLKDLGGEGMGPMLQRDLYINTAPTVQIERVLRTRHFNCST